MTTVSIPLFHSVCTKITPVNLHKMLRVNKLQSGKRYASYFNRNHTQPTTMMMRSNAKKPSVQCFFSTSGRLSGTGARPELTAGLSKQQAQELSLRLTSEERALLLSALQEYQSQMVKDEYLGQLAAYRWRSRFGRPSKLPSLGDVDPTGSYCPVPEDWLKKKCAESVTPPTTKELFGIANANSIPFIGFGFLDNFIMIIAGDYIDLYLGSYLCLSTMAAAALGNTFSDILGIGSAYYIERFASYIGYQPPKLTPIQLDMPVSRHFANLGRVIGVTIGCLLGMIPLLFLPSDEEKEKKKQAAESAEKKAAAVIAT